MAITFRNFSAWSERTTSTTVAIPGTTATGDRMFLLASWKDYAITATVANADSWAEVTEFADGTTATGNGIGSMKVGCWYKDHDGSETDPTLTFSSTVGLIAGAAMLSFQKGGGDTWDTPSFVTAAITNWTNSAQTVTSSSNATVPSGGVVIGLAGICDNGATSTWPADGSGIAGSGITWAANSAEAPSNHLTTATGDDMLADAGYRLVTTGATTSLTQTRTLGAADTGAALWIVQGLASPVVAPHPWRKPYAQIGAH
jgi:hypothetical protein